MTDSSARHAPAAQADDFRFPGLNRSTLWAEVVGLVLFALFWHHVRAQWLLARISHLGASVETVLLPEICTVLVITTQAVFLIWLHGLNLRTVGLRIDRIEGQVVWGLGIGAAMYAVAYTTDWLMAHAVRLPEQPQVPEWILTAPRGRLLVMLLVTAVGTETLYRGLLLPRVYHATGSATVAVLLCAATELVPYVWANYEWQSIVTTLAVNLVACGLYLRARSLGAAILGNVLYGFLGFILVPGTG